MTISIRVSKATSENAAYARTNDRVNSIEAKNTQQDSIIEGNTADIESLKSFKQKVESIIDVDCKDALILNIGGEKIRLILNDDKTVTWDYIDLKNESTISATSITLGNSVTISGKASGGTSPYTYLFEAKHSTSSSYSVRQDYSTKETCTWKPAKTGTYSIRITVKDSEGDVAEKYIDLTVLAAEGDEPNSENPTIESEEY